MGLLLLFCIGRCIFSGNRGYRNVNAYVVTTPGQQQYGAPPGQYYAPPPPPSHPNAPGWVDPAVYNGPSPMAPPPSYTPRNTPPPPPQQQSYEMNPTTRNEQAPVSSAPPHNDTPNPDSRRLNQVTL